MNNRINGKETGMLKNVGLDDFFFDVSKFQSDGNLKTKELELWTDGGKSNGIFYLHTTYAPFLFLF